MPAAKRRTISPGVASPASTSSRTRCATWRASDRRQCTPSLPGGFLVSHEQLEGRSQHGCAAAVGRLERLELLTELRAEERIHRRENLGARTVVLRERQYRRCCLAPLAEDGDVGVAEPVDRLELVTDEEEVTVVVAAAEEVEELGLEPVRILELVDHDRAEALLLALSDPFVRPQQVACPQLQILEVERRLSVLRLRVCLREGREQLLQELPVARGELFERRRDDRVAGLGERRRARPTHFELGQRQQPLWERDGADQVERRRGRPVLRFGRAFVAEQAARSLAERVDALRERRPHSTSLEHELPSR